MHTMKSFACGTIVPGCDGVVTGETDNDVLAAAHAAHAHGTTEVPDGVVAAIRAGITERRRVTSCTTIPTTPARWVRSPLGLPHD